MADIKSEEPGDLGPTEGSASKSKSTPATWPVFLPLKEEARQKLFLRFLPVLKIFVIIKMLFNLILRLISKSP